MILRDVLLTLNFYTLILKFLDIFLPRVPENEECIVATHSRVGRDTESNVFWDDEEEEEEEDDRTYFLPKVDTNSNRYANLSPISGLENSRQWFLVAQAHGTTIQLFCLPLGWKQNNNEDNIDYEQYDMEGENNSQINTIPFYLTSKLILPVGGKVLKIGFYGDDGKSSLSSGIDSGTGMEGRQKIGFIYQKNNSPLSATELWTTTYDSLSWQPVPFDPMLLNVSQVDRNCSKEILPVSFGESHDEEDGILFANCKFKPHRIFIIYTRYQNSRRASASHVSPFPFSLNNLTLAVPRIKRSNHIGRFLH